MSASRYLNARPNPIEFVNTHFSEAYIDNNGFFERHTPSVLIIRFLNAFIHSIYKAIQPYASAKVGSHRNRLAVKVHTRWNVNTFYTNHEPNCYPLQRWPKPYSPCRKGRIGATFYRN